MYDDFKSRVSWMSPRGVSGRQWVQSTFEVNIAIHEIKDVYNFEDYFRFDVDDDRASFSTDAKADELGDLFDLDRHEENHSNLDELTEEDELYKNSFYERSDLSENPLHDEISLISVDALNTDFEIF